MANEQKGNMFGLGVHKFSVLVSYICFDLYL